MRKQQVTVTMLVSLLLMVVAAAAQTPSQLDRVNVVRGTDDIRVEMSASGTVSPKLSSLDSPARVVVELPETTMATGQSHIAVVTNTLNKAYFLRENDPVFNGYVVKITGDSVVFQETVQDKLGKSFTREVVKRIFTPAV